ncbi:MAG: hypothetical protein JO027_07890, partial [Solirubrobacterales bacterium]|nr:hypothetical protein [Solirubrobacterales bacterium]
MTLARAWRRQLYGASSAALIVPSAMLAALLVLALGGDFRQVGVLGQIFAGPPVPSATGGAPAGARVGAAAPSLPVIPAATGSFSPGARGGGAGRGGGTGAGRNRVVPVATRGPGQTGGAITPVGAVTPIVGAGGSAPRPTPVAPPSRPAPTPRPPQPGP